jgi:stage V sporulation protein D (sporulation-specific penicillin-binding protein)
MRVSNTTVRKRLFYAFALGLFLFLVIDFRLGYVQIFTGNSLTDKAKDSWSRNVPFEPKRGEIKDRNGVVLATNKSTPTVYVVPRQIKKPKEAAKQLSALLIADEKKIYQHLTKKTMIERIPEGRKITNELAEQIRVLRIDGVYIAEDSRRFYPFGNELSQVLGFAGIDNQGLVGLELTYDKMLKGIKGNVKFYSDAKGQKLKNLSDDYESPKNGNDLVLTIDNKVQTIIERELEMAQAQYNPDSMVAIAVNPNTGEILGMSNRPNFNPSEYKDVDQEIYNRNLPVWATYEPGSTFKIITLAAALEEKKVDLLKDQFHDSGHIKIGGARIKCWKAGGHGSQNFLNVVQNSCNPGFVELGNRLGKETLFSYIRNFGFGTKTGIDLSGESTGILFQLKNVGPLELATTAFGQGVSVTPIQQVMAVSAAVNGGLLYTPFVAKEVVNPATGEVISRKTPQLKGRVISEETSKMVRETLESVVAVGTGRGAYVENFRVGGKTGTAQKAVDGQYLEGNYIVSFIGFAPADHPEIVVYVAVDNPKGVMQFGGVVAAPIVGRMLDDMLPALQVAPRTTQIEKRYQWPDPITIETPNLIGMTKKEIITQFYNLKAEFVGEGSKVVEQSPEPGVKIQEGSTVRVMLGN